MCKCLTPGFKLDQDGRSCREYNKKNSKNKQIVEVVTKKTCTAGFELVNGECFDVNECAQFESPEHGSCQNLGGTYRMW